jgi:hypothetical protein
MAEIISFSARLARCRLARFPFARFDDPTTRAIHTQQDKRQRAQQDNRLNKLGRQVASDLFKNIRVCILQPGAELL